MVNSQVTKKEKFWYLIGPIVTSFIFSATYPIIQVYFINLIEPRVLATANVLGTLVSAGVNYTIPIEKMKEWYRKHFLWIVLIDLLAFVSVSFFGYEYPEVRFVGLSLLNAVTTSLWVMVMRNLANRIIKDGDDRTDFEALTEYTSLLACAGGAIFAIIFIDIHVEYCIAAQCIANIFMGITDLYSFKLLKRAYETCPNTEDKDS